MSSRLFYFEWKRREEFRKAVENAGGERIGSIPGADFYYLESNSLYLIHSDGRSGGVVNFEVNDIFAEEIMADVKIKLGLKLEEKLGV